eukprot:m.364236 g.364236  ORF g.364236 m.364236 type:complete len:253 (-) comp26086_c0_seq1:188-946(-)
MASSMSDHQSRLPRLFAFDLDGLIWDPEMYELWGGGPPFRRQGEVVVDRRGVQVRMLGVSRQALRTLKQDERFEECKVAYVSRCDEPKWARQCMKLFHVDGDGTTMYHTRDIEIISKESKRTMFQRIHRDTGIPYEEMVFYDNQRDNMHAVAPLGVRCVYCPRGLQHSHWEASLSAFASIATDATHAMWEAALNRTVFPVVLIAFDLFLKHVDGDIHAGSTVSNPFMKFARVEFGLTISLLFPQVMMWPNVS